MSLTEPRTAWIGRSYPRLWVVWAASRPSQLALILLVYLMGIGVGLTGPPITTASPEGITHVPVIYGAIALLVISIPVHYANEFVDVRVDRMADWTPFSGGSGAVSVTGVGREYLRTLFVSSLGIAGIVLVSVSVFGLLPRSAVVLLAIGLLGGVAYSLPPIAFIRRGVGELVNAFLGAILLTVYGVAIVATADRAALLVPVPFFFFVLCNLLATHWADRRVDASVGKRTLAVRFTARQVRLLYWTFGFSAAVSVFVLWLMGIFPTVVALAHLIAFPALIYGGGRVTRQPDPQPAVFSMVLLAFTATGGWWWVVLG